MGSDSQSLEQVTPYKGRRRPPTRKRPQPGWHYLQVAEYRSGYRLAGLTIKAISGDREEVRKLLGKHTTYYVERTHLTSRQMNGRLVRKTLSFFKLTDMLRACCGWEERLQLDPPAKDITARSKPPRG